MTSMMGGRGLKTRIKPLERGFIRHLCRLEM